ncbi:filamentous hemagglutinin N-terminal domain-containing protein, partial [Proteus mirabilis]|nr:hemagglutinin [Proteus mirabilis]
DLLMKATYAYLDKKINLDDSYFTVDVERISIGNVKLSDNSNFFILSDKNISLRGKIRGYGHVILESNDDYMDIKNKEMLIGTDKSKLEGGTKYKLGTTTIIDYSKYK